jgi:hypothetical protein
VSPSDASRYRSTPMIPGGCPAMQNGGVLMSDVTDVRVLVSGGTSGLGRAMSITDCRIVATAFAEGIPPTGA